MGSELGFEEVRVGMACLCSSVSEPSNVIFEQLGVTQMAVDWNHLESPLLTCLFS
jgi:hypothetical protein